jgi:Domain of unknown function (DUF6457)
VARVSRGIITVAIESARGRPQQNVLNAREWIDAFAGRLGTEPPTTEQFKILLDLAGEAAHSSERVAAPVACWVAARAGAEVDDALRVARELSADG